MFVGKDVRLIIKQFVNVKKNVDVIFLFFVFLKMHTDNDNSLGTKMFYERRVSSP